jgi:hypothetical protein
MSTSNIAARPACTCSESPISALHVEICMVQHLSRTAQSRRPTVILDAALRPVKGDISASRNILSAKTSASGQSVHLQQDRNAPKSTRYCAANPLKSRRAALTDQNGRFCHIIRVVEFTNAPSISLQRQVPQEGYDCSNLSLQVPGGNKAGRRTQDKDRRRFRSGLEFPEYPSDQNHEKC